TQSTATVLNIDIGDLAMTAIKVSAPLSTLPTGDDHPYRSGAWQPNLAEWEPVRALDVGDRQARSPEIHFFDGLFWVTLGLEGGGCDLVRFDGLDLDASGFRRERITERGEDPSLFRDDDGAYYWVMGAGEIARMKADPLEGLAEEPHAVIEPLAGELRSVAMRGAFLAKINGFYHLFVGERRLRHGDLGRTGAQGGTDDTFVAVSSRPDSGYAERRYLVFPHAGQTTLFRDSEGAWRATYSCTDARGVFRLKPGAFRIEIVDATRPVWPIGFTGLDQPSHYQPQGFLLRPDSAFVYEGGIGLLKPVPMDKVPGQRAEFPWIRDTCVTRGGDGAYYMTGTTGNLDAVHLWRSRDLQRFEYLAAGFTLDPSDPGLWYNKAKNRLLWAPEIHCLNGQYWIAWCVNQQLGMGLLKSRTGRPEGPYMPTYEGNRPFLAPRIDASLFVDDDGTPYFVWQGRYIRRLNREMSDFEGEPVELMTVDGEQVGYEGIFLRKIGRWHVVIAAEWNGGGNREDGTYDMMYAVSKSLFGPYSRRRVGVPHGGHSALFQDSAGAWHLSFFGNDRTAPFRAMPGVVALDVRDTGDDLVISPLLDVEGRPVPIRFP
ncbi:MAG: family 43 glycosylhydrolase, partial [Candidatus Sumerlaeota bacterium]|nr:family 43 glycosylhydrolase [Candidatus Sumerlaeota bacterium]